MKKKLLVLLAAVLVLAGVAVGYVVYARTGSAAAENAVPVEPGEVMLSQEDLLIRNTAQGTGFGKVGAVPVTAPGGPRRLTDLSCDRFAFSRRTGLCLAVQPGTLPPESDVLILDEHLRVHRKLTLPGTPSRARVSPDGRYAYWTMFINGDSYAETGFSTRAGVYDTETGQVVNTIEELPVFLDDKRYFSMTSTTGVSPSRPTAIGSTPLWAPRGTRTWSKTTTGSTGARCCATASNARRSRRTARGSRSRNVSGTAGG